MFLAGSNFLTPDLSKHISFHFGILFYLLVDFYLVLVKNTCLAYVWYHFVFVNLLLNSRRNKCVYQGYFYWSLFTRSAFLSAQIDLNGAFQLFYAQFILCSKQNFLLFLGNFLRILMAKQCFHRFAILNQYFIFLFFFFQVSMLCMQDGYWTFGLRALLT